MTRLGRADVHALPLYRPDVTTCDVDLSDNTNLWGPPPAAIRAIANAASRLSRYPSLYSEPLREAILRYAGVASPTEVVTGCGSDDVLDSAMRAFGSAGDAIAYSVPTFSMIPVLARLNGLDRKEIPLTRDFDVDAERLVDCGAAITYVCTPNNPTATVVSRAAVEYVVEHASGLVVLDEAYAEFAPDTFQDLLAKSERLLIARTFSKAFGMAGLRVGYGLGANAVVRLVEKARGPYKVTSLAEQAVLATLGADIDGVEWVRQHAALAIANRERLVVELARLGFSALPSAANFILVPTLDALTLADALRDKGVLVRAFAGLPAEIPVFAEHGRAALRIGVGPWEMMEQLLDRLAAVR
jgi:histidinol-phosphate aminotransferase